MRKIPRTAKLDEAVIISKLDKHEVLLPINYRASKNSLFKANKNKRSSKNYPIYFKLDSLQKLIINRLLAILDFDAAI